MCNFQSFSIFYSFLYYLFSFCFFFFNDTATTEIYTLSLHDALPIYTVHQHAHDGVFGEGRLIGRHTLRSEEHTSELQSRQYIVCRLLLEKKKKHINHILFKQKKQKKKKTTIKQIH